MTTLAEQDRARLMAALELLKRPFDRKQISKLPSSARRPALDYVGHAVVTARLNEAAPDWEYRIEPIVVHGKIVNDDKDKPHFVPDPSGLPHVVAVFGEMTILGVTRQEVGEVDNFSTYGLELKNAISDFIRRAAMRFGVALDLWTKEDLAAAPANLEPASRVGKSSTPSVPDDVEGEAAPSGATPDESGGDASGEGGVPPDSDGSVSEARDLLVIALGETKARNLLNRANGTGYTAKSEHAATDAMWRKALDAYENGG